MFEVIDVHVHLYGTGSESDCRMSQRLRFLSRLFWIVYKKRPLKKIDDKSIREEVLGAINTSAEVDKAVLLAFDKVYDPNGQALWDHTHLYTSNRYVAEICKNQPRALFGASIHPARKDWEHKLQQVMDWGAVLVKWIPAAQNIDLEAPYCQPFYKVLAEARLPLLCHVGDEHTIPDAFRKEDCALYNHPNKLRAALEENVAVIAAHCCTPLYSKDHDWTRQFIELMNEEKYKDLLYADVAALVSCKRLRVKKARQVFQGVKLAPERRFVLGSDYPTPITLRDAMVPEVEREDMRRVRENPNYIDRNVKLLPWLGVPGNVTTNAGHLFGKRMK